MSRYTRALELRMGIVIGRYMVITESGLRR